jgi:hypothetical protein
MRAIWGPSAGPGVLVPLLGGPNSTLDAFHGNNAKVVSRAGNLFVLANEYWEFLGNEAVSTPMSVGCRH